jgi:flagellar motor switch protein FliM
MAFIEDLVSKVGLKDKLIETRDVEIVLLKKQGKIQGEKVKRLEEKVKMLEDKVKNVQVLMSKEIQQKKAALMEIESLRT